MSTFENAALLALVALLPLIVLTLTSFVKVSVVLSLLRNAIGSNDAPSGLVITGLSLVLTFFVMAPVAVDMVQAASTTPAPGQPAPGQPPRGQLTPAPQPAGAIAPAGTTPTAGTLTTGNPTAGTPTAGTPTAGTPTAGTPTAGTPAAGTSTAGTPTAGAPAAGTSTAGTPTAGTPTAGAPAAGTSTAGTPAAGTSTAGTPTTGTPTATTPGAAATAQAGDRDVGAAVRALVPAQYAAQVAAAERALEPLRGFLWKHTREADRETFSALAGSLGSRVKGDEVWVLAPAFIATELREAFMIAILIFIPFLVIDLIVALSLASLGLTTTSPQTVALPLKLVLFVAVDGWRLLLDGLLRGYV